MMIICCQVLVTQEGLDWEEEVMLYHHCDGYPSYIVPRIKQANEDMGNAWEAGRAGKVAGMICSSDPGEFEPESSLDLRDNIEYLYIVTAVSTQGGTITEHPYWTLKVLIPGKMFYKEERPTQKDMVAIYDGLLSKAEVDEIERVASEKHR